MKKALLLLLIVSALVSCKSRLKPNEEQKAFIDEFSRQLSLPINADSAFVAGLDTLEAMDLSRLEKLEKDTLQHKFALQLNNSIKACILIEKIKQSGRYQGYLDSLSPGMLKNAMAFKIGKVVQDDGTSLLFWGINESSFDADPFYSGMSIIVSYPNTKGGFTHIVVDEDYTAGDPPSFLQKRTTSQISVNEIKITTKSQARDTDDAPWNKETYFLKLELKAGEVKVLQEVNSKN